MFMTANAGYLDRKMRPASASAGFAARNGERSGERIRENAERSDCAGGEKRRSRAVEASEVASSGSSEAGTGKGARAAVRGVRGG